MGQTISGIPGSDNSRNGGSKESGIFNQYLNTAGFAPIGLPLAWAIKLSHVACAILLILNRYIWLAAIVTIPILVAGIIMIHAAEGWFVVGAGRNGAEFNVLLISVLLYMAIINRKGLRA